MRPIQHDRPPAPHCCRSRSVRPHRRGGGLRLPRGCGFRPGSALPPPSTARIVDQNGKPVTVTGKAATELAPPDPDGGLICRYGTLTGLAKLRLQAWAPLTVAYQSPAGDRPPASSPR